MIVKDEEHVIERALNSCVDFIDAYCIVDTGSTDKTKNVINAFFDKHPKIPGKIVDFEFTNFEECRNKSIEHGKDLGDYGFWIDADEELRLNSTWNKNTFKKHLNDQQPDQMLFKCVYGGLRYNRGQLYRFKSNYTWYGPVHEILRSIDIENETGEDFPYGDVFIRAEGNSWTGDISKKYEDHANILLEYQEENDWKDPRWTFYLAQSYKDAALIAIGKNAKDERGLDLIKKACNFYKDRVATGGGFRQEIYYSQLMVGRLSLYTTSTEHVIYELSKCEEYNSDGRIEHIFELTTLYRDAKMWRNAKMVSDIAHSILHNNKNKATLFVEHDIYTWRFYDNFSVVLYFNGLLDESLRVTEWILDKYSKQMPDVERNRIENNKKLTANSISARQNPQL